MPLLNARPRAFILSAAKDLPAGAAILAAAAEEQGFSDA
jgi:hypothetical protein